MRSYYCMCCNRELSVEKSIDRGLGPICAGRRAMEASDNPMADKTDLPFDEITKDIVIERRADGLHFNIYQVIYHHSPTGFEIGYEGSGPADLALNILELFCRDMGMRATLALRNWPPGKDGSTTIKVCDLAWHLHQDFKRAFIARLDRNGGTISGDAIRHWISEQQQTSRYALAA